MHDSKRTPIVGPTPSPLPFMARSPLTPASSGRQSSDLRPGQINLTPLPTPIPDKLEGTVPSPSPSPNAMGWPESTPKNILDMVSDGFDEDLSNYDTTFACYSTLN